MDTWKSVRGTRRTAKMMNERDTWKISSFVSKNSKLRSQVQVKHSRRVHRKEILNDNLLQYPSCEQTFHKYRSTREWKTSFLQVFVYVLWWTLLFIDKLSNSSSQLMSDLRDALLIGSNSSAKCGLKPSSFTSAYLILKCITSVF